MALESKQAFHKQASPRGGGRQVRRGADSRLCEQQSLLLPGVYLQLVLRLLIS